MFFYTKLNQFNEYIYLRLYAGEEGGEESLGTRSFPPPPTFFFFSVVCLFRIKLVVVMYLSMHREIIFFFLPPLEEKDLFRCEIMLWILEWCRKQRWAWIAAQSLLLSLSSLGRSSCNLLSLAPHDESGPDYRNLLKIPRDQSELKLRFNSLSLSFICFVLGLRPNFFFFWVVCLR